MRHVFIAVLLLAALAGTAVAGPYEGAIAAYERGDYATTLRLLRPLAEQGLAAAQYSVGIMYDRGDGVPQSYVQAAKWYRLAAEQGLAEAQFNLGNMYRKGEGVPQDYAGAVKWYRQAAELGLAMAQQNLGARRKEPHVL